MKFFRRILFIILVIAFSSCKKDSTILIDDSLPIVMVHGYLGSGDSYEWMAQRFTSNGFPANKIFTFDWNTSGQGADNNTKPLERFIQKVLQQTGAKKVNLVGHSLGGSLSYNFCKVPSNAALVAHLALIAPYLRDRTAVPSDSIPTLNIWPNTDYVVIDGAALPGAINIELNNIDHNEAVACNETFQAVFKLFTGKDPSTLIVKSEAEPILSGKTVSFVENITAVGAKVEVYEVNPLTGYRISNTPTYIFKTDANGFWGPMTADPSAYYEFRVSTGKPGDRPLHFYREPFTHSDHLVYLRTYPPITSILAIGLSVIPKNNSEASAIFFSGSKALWLGRDELSINGISLTNASFLQPELNTLAIFLYDSNKNGMTDATSIDLFQGFQSLKGSDFYFPANPAGSITFNLNGRLLRTPNWPSADEGVSVALFE